MWLMICKQLINRWRSSLSVCLELLLVFCLAWFLLDYFFVESYNRSLPVGRSYDGVWLVEMGLLPENAREYVAAESDSVNLPVHYARILERLCAYPGVSKVGASYGCASLPYSPCYGPHDRLHGDVVRPDDRLPGGLLAALRRRRAGGFYRRLRLGRPAGGAHYSADGAEALR